MALTDRWWDKILASTNKAANATGLKDDAADAKRDSLLEQTIGELDGVSLPELERLSLENPEWLDDLVYQDMQAASQGRSEFDSINVDPNLRREQEASLSALKEISDSGGFNSSDRANLSRIQTQAATADKGRRDAILQGMQMRGMGGSGNELLAQLQSSQAATNREAQQGLDVAGMAQDRALQSIMQSGQLAGGMRDQDYSEQARKAQSQDAINRFNTSNQNQAAQFNTGNQFRADQYNNQGRQNIANQATANNNQTTVYNQGLNQQNYDNQMGHVAAKAQARGQQVANVTDQSNRNQQTNANVLSGVVKAGTKLFSSDKKQEDEEEGGWF